ncbi:MAG: DUF2255 family protein [Myxococcota bacterium]
MHRLVPVLLLLLPFAASAQDEGVPEWADVADVETVQVVTDNGDGTTSDTTVWLAVVDGQGYIRTGNSGWGGNVLRNQDVELRIGDVSYELHVYFVEDDELRQQITDAFREKYGWSDAFISLFRGSHPTIMRLTSR